jgi:hypothetical protein
VVLTVALAVLLLLQVPPVVALLSVLELPGQAVAVPVIAATVGGATTLIELVTTAVPQALVTAYDIVALPRLTP